MQHLLGTTRASRVLLSVLASLVVYLLHLPSFTPRPLSITSAPPPRGLLRSPLQDYGTLTAQHILVSVPLPNGGASLARLMSMNGSTASPILETQPGGTLQFVLRNSLDAERTPFPNSRSCWPPPGLDVRTLPPGTNPQLCVSDGDAQG
jgi:hypothetical protein